MIELQTAGCGTTIIVARHILGPNAPETLPVPWDAVAGVSVAVAVHTTLLHTPAHICSPTLVPVQSTTMCSAYAQLQATKTPSLRTCHLELHEHTGPKTMHQHRHQCWARRLLPGVCNPPAAHMYILARAGQHLPPNRCLLSDSAACTWVLNTPSTLPSTGDGDVTPHPVTA